MSCARLFCKRRAPCMCNGSSGNSLASTPELMPEQMVRGREVYELTCPSRVPRCVIMLSPRGARMGEEGGACASPVEVRKTDWRDEPTRGVHRYRLPMA